MIAIKRIRLLINRLNLYIIFALSSLLKACFLGGKKLLPQIKDSDYKIDTKPDINNQEQSDNETAASSSDEDSIYESESKDQHQKNNGTIKDPNTGIIYRKLEEGGGGDCGNKAILEIIKAINPNYPIKDDRAMREKIAKDVVKFVSMQEALNNLNNENGISNYLEICREVLSDNFFLFKVLILKCLKSWEKGQKDALEKWKNDLEKIKTIYNSINNTKTSESYADEVSKIFRSYSLNKKKDHYSQDEKKNVDLFCEAFKDFKGTRAKSTVSKDELTKTNLNLAINLLELSDPNKANEYFFKIQKAAHIIFNCKSFDNFFKKHSKDKDIIPALKDLNISSLDLYSIFGDHQVKDLKEYLENVAIDSSFFTISELRPVLEAAGFVFNRYTVNEDVNQPHGIFIEFFHYLTGQIMCLWNNATSLSQIGKTPGGHWIALESVDPYNVSVDYKEECLEVIGEAPDK